MNKFLTTTLRGDKVLWAVFALLFIVSMVEMFSASSKLVHQSAYVYDPILRHVKNYTFGFVALLLVQVVDFKYIRLLGYVGLFFSLALLVYVLFFGVTQGNAARWISIAGFQFQPSEFAKLSLIVVVSDLVERFQTKEQQDRNYKYIASLVIVVCGLIFLENFSTAAILFVIVMAMMWIGEIDYKKILSTFGVVLAVVMLVLAVAVVVPEDVYARSTNPALKLIKRSYTWVSRIDNFFTDEEVSKYVITDDNFQANHAQIAVARGGFFPSGPGTSVERNYLPEAFSDFIFAIIVEELGAIIACFIVALYLILLFRAGKVAQQSDSLFCAILVIGVTLMIVMQAFVHVGVSVHLGPVTGQPLPLISNGGTSILINCIYFGIIISVTRYIQDQQLIKQKVAEAKEESLEKDNKQSKEIDIIEETK
jgi:cell division protein FtsW